MRRASSASNPSAGEKLERSSLLLVFGLPAIACAAWTVYAGKDVNWDLLNYHYYLPFELLAGRIDQDFFAASAQSYLNPVGYVPFYLMVSSGWHSVVVSIALAAVHSLSIGLLFLLAWRMFAHLPQGERTVLSCLATALGTATSVFWATVGASFLDPLLVPPMLAGLLLLLDRGDGAERRAAFAGALFGAAAALKYSNAIFVLAALPLTLVLPGLSGVARLRTSLSYVAGAALAVGVLAGPWFVLLMREFANPVFPLMNAWFQSPHAPPVNLIGERFLPQDLAAALTFPFRMVALDRSLYSETFAPDLRFAAMTAAMFALAALAAVRAIPAARSLRGTDWRLLAFLGIGYVLWQAGSANGRYGMILLLLVGVCVARIAERLLPSRAARTALAVLLLVQLAMTIIASPSRWFVVEPWSRRWLPYEAPEAALRAPSTYLSVEILPMAVVAPFVHPASSFVNFRGQHSLPTDSPRLRQILERYRGRVRALGRGLLPADGRLDDDQVKAYDATLLRIGYRLDTRNCYVIAWRPDTDDWLSRAANWLAGPQPPHEPLSVASCALRTAARDRSDIERERHASIIFDRIEKSCPRLFRAQTAVTEPLGAGWSRNYTGLDARLEAVGTRVILNRYRAGLRIDLGALSDWEQEGATVPAACREG